MILFFWDNVVLYTKMQSRFEVQVEANGNNKSLPVNKISNQPKIWKTKYNIQN